MIELYESDPGAFETFLTDHVSLVRLPPKPDLYYVINSLARPHVPPTPRIHLEPPEQDHEPAHLDGHPEQDAPPGNHEVGRRRHRFREEIEPDGRHDLPEQADTVRFRPGCFEFPVEGRDHRVPIRGQFQVGGHTIRAGQGRPDDLAVLGQDVLAGGVGD